jgi:diacylglycerol kinase (ATP)
LVVLVVNPTSGGGKGRRLLPAAVEGLHRLDIDPLVIVSENGDHPEQAAREAVSSGAQVLVALGGDGLIGACANGLVGGATTLAVVPAGNGNDFARSIGLDPKRPVTALQHLARPARPIDVVRVDGPGWERHYVGVGGAGFDSETNELANRMRVLRGTAKYVMAVFRTLARFRPARFRLTIDGEQRDLEAMMVAVANSRSYGGGMLVAPDASMSDGLLDVCLVGALSKPSFVATFPKVFKGTHVGHPAVTLLRGRKIELEASRGFTVYADGERLGPLPATFTVLPGALEVHAP